MKILVTGFGPFPNVPHNVTQLIAKAVDGRTFYGMDIIGIDIKVSWTEAWPEISAAIEKHRPIALISFGVIAGTNHIVLEKVAHNTMDGRTDGLNKTASSGLIVKNGPPVLESSLPLQPLYELITEQAGRKLRLTKHYPAAQLLNCKWSIDAGKYLCNYVFYQNTFHPADELLYRGFIHIGDQSVNNTIQSGIFVVKAIANWLANQQLISSINAIEDVPVG